MDIGDHQFLARGSIVRIVDIDDPDQEVGWRLDSTGAVIAATTALPTVDPRVVVLPQMAGLRRAGHGPPSILRR